MKISEGGSDVDSEVVPLQAVLLSCTHDAAVLVLTLLLLQFDVKHKNVFVTRTKAGQNMVKTWKIIFIISQSICGCRHSRLSSHTFWLIDTAPTAFHVWSCLTSERGCCCRHYQATATYLRRKCNRNWDKKAATLTRGLYYLLNRLQNVNTKYFELKVGWRGRWLRKEGTFASILTTEKVLFEKAAKEARKCQRKSKTIF